MTEELKQKAEEWVKHNSDESIHSFNGEQLQKAYTDGAIENTTLLSKRILELQKTNGTLTDRVNELNKLFADCDTCRRTCDIGNCCKFGSAYLPDTEKVLNKNKQLTEAKEIIRELVNIIDYLNEDEYGKEDSPVVHKAEAFINKE